MATKSMWEYVAHKVQADYGAYVDWEERFYLCPECGEPIYEDDWHETDFVVPENCTSCPICDFIYETGEKYA